MRTAGILAILLIPFGLCLAQESAKHEMGHEHGEHHEMMPPDPHTPQGENLQVPEGWVVRLDKPDPDVSIGAMEDNDIYFVNMTPGWHITAHQRAIFYHPANTVEGNFTAKASIFLFDPGQRDREGFGIFVGGKNLDGDAQSYVYFLLRNTGDFLIKRRTGSETSVVVDWAHTDAMKVHAHDGTDSVLNDLAVKADEESVRFLVNGTEVAKVPRADLDVDGIFGLRVNHGLNVHVSDLGMSM